MHPSTAVSIASWVLLSILPSTVMAITVWKDPDFQGPSENSDPFICGPNACHELTYGGSFKWCEKVQKIVGATCPHEIDLYEQPGCPVGGAYWHLAYDKFVESKTTFKHKSYKKLCRPGTGK